MSARLEQNGRPGRTCACGLMSSVECMADERGGVERVRVEEEARSRRRRREGVRVQQGALAGWYSVRVPCVGRLLTSKRGEGRSQSRAGDGEPRGGRPHLAPLASRRNSSLVRQTCSQLRLDDPPSPQPCALDRPCRHRAPRRRDRRMATRTRPRSWAGLQSRASPSSERARPPWSRASPTSPVRPPLPPPPRPSSRSHQLMARPPSLPPLAPAQPCANRHHHRHRLTRNVRHPSRRLC